MSKFSPTQVVNVSHARILLKLIVVYLFLGVSVPRCALSQEIPSHLEANAKELRPPNTSAIGQVSSEQATDAAARDAAQNPVAAAISLPFQNNTYYGVGTYRRAENALLMEPVVPFRLSHGWALITRTIVPVEVIPRLSPIAGVDYGLGNIQPGFYLSTARPGKLVLAAGTILWLPTATDHVLGLNKWGGGPSVAGVYSHGHWLGGAILSNEFAGVHHQHVDELTLNPFLFYNMRHGWYFFSSSVITADWTAERSHRWEVPVGGGAGRVFKIGSQPLNARAEFLNDVRTTSSGPDWQLQVQLQLLFVQEKKK